MSIFKIRIDHGKSGDEDYDEIYAPGFSFTSPLLSREQCENHVAEVDSNGKTCHFLTYGATDFCVHQSAVDKLGQFDAELIRLNLDSTELSKLQRPFNKGTWYGIRPSKCIELHPSSSVEYFEGEGVKAKVFREVKSYVFEKRSVADVELFQVQSHGSDCFVTKVFRDRYLESGLTGLRFIDVKCKMV